jgi:hypothetical protein
MNQFRVLGVALVVAVVALGGLSYYTYSTLNTQLSNDKATLTSQIDSLQTLVAEVQQSETSDAGQIATLQTGLKSVQSELTAVSAELNSTRSNDAAFQAGVSAQLQNITAALNAIATKLSSLFPQVPLTTLVIINDTYDNTTHTFTFVVQNTQNYPVSAQLSATLEDYCNNGFWWYYISQIYTFSPHGNLSIPMNLALSYQYPNHVPTCNAIYEALVVFVIPTSTAVSSSYQFQVTPTYDHP